MSRNRNEIIDWVKYRGEDFLILEDKTVIEVVYERVDGDAIAPSWLEDVPPSVEEEVLEECDKDV